MSSPTVGSRGTAGLDLDAHVADLAAGGGLTADGRLARSQRADALICRHPPLIGSEESKSDVDKVRSRYSIMDILRS